MNDKNPKKQSKGENMEEFICEIENNLKTTESPISKNTKLRELISKVVSYSPYIKDIEDLNEEGDVVFKASMKDLGLTYDLFCNYKSEIFSVFTANFIGELLVRENIDLFAKILTKIEVEDYPDMVHKYGHKKFGMEICNDIVLFKFHISLIQYILIEEFRSV